MSGVCRLAAVLIMASALAGCAYKPLKAPCSPDEGGVPLGFADDATRYQARQPFAPLDMCGPMKPI